jgi:hypothetical protein
VETENPTMEVVPPLQPPRTYDELLAAIERTQGAIDNLHFCNPAFSVWSDHLKELLALQARWLTLSVPAPIFQVDASWSSTNGNR